MESSSINKEYLKQYQWLSLPSTLALIFVALTKGYEGLGFWLTLLLGELIFVSVWYNIYNVTINKSPPNKKQYYYSTTVYQILFIGLCLYYVLYI